MCTVQNYVKERHTRDETEFWIRRPLTGDLLEYAAFDILQLRALHKFYRPRLSNYTHIAAESKRYVELYKDELRPKHAWYVDHGILPQEILERSPEVKALHDKYGTRTCGGCKRELHQDSYRYLFRSWTSGQLCCTCTRAKLYSERPPPTRRLW